MCCTIENLFNEFLNYILFFCVCGCFTCVYACVPFPWRPEECNQISVSPRVVLGPEPVEEAQCSSLLRCQLVPEWCWDLSLWRTPSAPRYSALPSPHPRKSWLAAASVPPTCDNCILPARNGGIHYGRRAQFLFYGDEHKAASGASCHRDDHRNWLGGVAVQGEKVCLVTSSLGLWVELSGRVVAYHEWCLGSVPSTTRNKISVEKTLCRELLLCYLGYHSLLGLG